MWLAGVAIALLATTGVVLLRSESAGPPQTAPSCRLTVPPSAAAGDTIADGVQIVEKGYTKIGPKASMGALIRNETDRVAYHTLVTFDALDAAGRTVVEADARIWQTQIVPVIRPGDTVAVGASILLGQDADRVRKSIGSIKVTLQVSQWLEPGDGTNGLGPVTATVVGGSGRREDDGQGSLRFTTESANCAMTHYNVRTGMASRGISVVFRDASGAITGGTLDTRPRHDTCLPGRQTDERFSTTQTDIPSRADLNQTSISVYCDFGGPSAQGGPGTPIN